MWRLIALLAMGCGSGEGDGSGDADSDVDTDVDTDTDTDTDTGTDFRGGCTDIESATPGQENFASDIGVVARTQQELDDAWLTAFEDPAPEQPAVDWATQEVVIFASTEGCPAACMLWLLDCEETRHALVLYMSGDCDAEWPVGGVLVVPRDERPVDYEARDIGDCTSGN